MRLLEVQMTYGQLIDSFLCPCTCSSSAQNSCPIHYEHNQQNQCTLALSCGMCMYLAFKVDILVTQPINEKFTMNFVTEICVRTHIRASALLNFQVQTKNPTPSIVSLQHLDPNNQPGLVSPCPKPSVNSMYASEQFCLPSIWINLTFHCHLRTDKLCCIVLGATLKICS